MHSLSHFVLLLPLKMHFTVSFLSAMFQCQSRTDRSEASCRKGKKKNRQILRHLHFVDSPRCLQFKVTLF